MALVLGGRRPGLESWAAEPRLVGPETTRRGIGPRHRRSFRAGLARSRPDATSPWSTSTVATGRTRFRLEQTGSVCRADIPSQRKAPAAVNARGSEGRIRDRAAGTANAGASASIDIKLPSSAEARGRNMRKVRNPDHDAAGFGSTDRDHNGVLGLWNPGQGSTRPLARRVGVLLNNQPSRFTLLCQTFV